MNNLSTEAILEERSKTHGDFKNHARITQSLKITVRNEIELLDKYQELTFSQREALDMILHKIGRIIAGNHNHDDHWDDIAGYAKLVANEIRENKKCASPSTPMTPRPASSDLYSLALSEASLFSTTQKVTSSS